MDERIPETIEWPPRRSRRRGVLIVLVALGAILFGGGSTISYYVEALWFDSLGYGSVFWKMLNLQMTVFAVFGALTFAILYGSFLALKPADLSTAGVIIVNGRPVALPVGPALHMIALLVSLVVALGTAAGMLAEWPSLALWWYAAPNGMHEALTSGAGAVDPIFGRPMAFYLFTLPAWQLVAGWLLTLAIITCGVAILFLLAGGGLRAIPGRGGAARSLRGLSIAWAFVLVMLAARVYLGRYERLLDAHTIFTGVTYTDAHVTLTGMLVVSLALVLGAAIALVSALTGPRIRSLVLAGLPAVACYVAVGLVGGYVNSFIVKPNELVREQPFITHNIEMTRQAYGLNRVVQRPFAAETSLESVDAARNQLTLQNIRLWDWRALQDTLRQIQEIRTYYDFADIDIDRYSIDGEMRQVMLAARELSVDKLPESSRNWINEKLIYTHGYGITMNPVNGFTPEGLPKLILSNMPVQSTTPSVTVTRPEIYFGELTNTDVYVKTRQKEFNYPQGQTNSLTSYEGTGGIVLGGFLRRIMLALDRGDVAKLPFSDDVSAESRLLMRRNVRDRVAALAPFLTVDPDPYIVVRDNGRLSWIMDAFTTSDRYPFSRAYLLEQNSINYIRNSVKIAVDAYDGTTTFYVFDAEDPILAAYRRIFPSLFQDGSAMPADLRRHVRYPEMLLALQAEVYGLYHMTNPEVFYNREDLWTIASEVGMNAQREQTAQPIEPNFVLMMLPEESRVEFVEILPFTPARRNNLIGWMAGRSDDPHYGGLVVYDFPKSRLVDGPLQVEARIDQNPQLSSQLTLWNQQGSHVRRGGLLVIPIGRGLLYAEPIYLQAERSPMPELRLVVLALQDRLSYGPTFEVALTGLFGDAIASAAGAPAGPAPPPAAAPRAGEDVDALIASAAKDLSEYQRLTAEGKLGEAGQKLEHLKRTLEELRKRPH
jgi:uncharacterized membrane protein (UPF0182 family)